MPQDSIIDWINNEESFYNEMNRLYDGWVEEGDVWSEHFAAREARVLVESVAEAIESMDFVTDKYSEKEKREAVDELIEDFEQYREEAIKAAVELEVTPPVPRPPMDESAREHAQKYDALAREIGIDFLRTLIPASPERVRKSLKKGDFALNTIPLRTWDDAGKKIQMRLTMAEKVSVLKHVAVWHYA